MDKRGRILLVGLGPGSPEHMTFRARQAIAESDSVVGYETYIELIKDLLAGQEVFQTGMQEEVARAKKAVELAEAGRTVAVVSSGDAGIYGLAGLVYEILKERGWSLGNGIKVEVVPGVTALSAAAALLGAPLMHDFCAISLSDLLTPWEVIVKRIEAAARADFVIALYNPASGRRQHQIAHARRILLEYRPPATPVGLVKNAYRQGQHTVVTDLEHLLDYEIGMLTTVIIGNSQTFAHEGLMVTPRGYRLGYRVEDRG